MIKARSTLGELFFIVGIAIIEKFFGPSYITFVHTLLKSSISHCTCLSFETLTSYNLLKFINEIGTVQFYDYRQRSRFCQNPFSADFRVCSLADRSIQLVFL